MAVAPQCPPGSDRHFGPRVDVECRSFDFTLAFEDCIFGILPSALFLLAVLPRARQLLRASVKVDSIRLLTIKLITLGILFVIQLVFTVFRTANFALATPFSLSSAVLNVIATLAAVFLSYLEDQRSVNPSSLLVLYLSAESILSLPRLRSLWMLSYAGVCTILWTAAVVFNVSALILESVRKTRFLKNNEKNATLEEICGFWGRSFFIWILPLFKHGYTTILTLDNMGQIDQELQGKPAHERLEAVWKADTSHKHAMLKSTLRAYLWPFLSAVFPRLFLTGFTFSQPFLITATVTYFEMPDTPETKYYGQALVGAFVLAYLGMAVSTAIYWRQAFRFVTLARAGLISMVYNQTIQVKALDLRDSAAITLMSTDVQRIVDSLRIVHELWASVLDIVIAIYLLERQLFAACVVPVVIALVSIFAISRISGTSNLSQKAWIERVQKRISATSNMLGDMKAVKMLGLAPTLSTIVEGLRNIEIKTSHHFRKLLMWQIFWSNMPIDLTPFATFAIFTIIAAVGHSGSLLTAQAFTSLSLISILTSPLVTFTQAVPSMAQCLGCFERIDAYCRITGFAKVAAERSILEQDSDSEIGTHENLDTSTSNSVQMEVLKADSRSNPLLSFKAASFSWSKDTSNVLHEINFELQPNTIKMIVGPVGSGKSTLLESMLGETTLTGGRISHSLSHVAYCSQTPWITNNTIRHNITGFGQFDETWYNHVIWATSLEHDLQQIPLGDSFMAGSNGVNLSGGQRQRVSLARAVYSRKSIVLLDDIASGLDTNTVQQIAARLFGPDGHFRKSGRAVILATHTLSLLKYADIVTVLENGRIVDEAAPGKNLLAEEIIKDSPDSERGASSNGSDKVSIEVEAVTKPAVITSIDEAETEVPDFARRDGTWSVYKYYCRMAKWRNIILFAVLAFALAFASNFPSLWIQWWSNANAKAPNSHLGMYLGVYGCLSLLSLITILIACWILFINIIENTALGLHTDLLRSALRAPFSFYRATDTGTTTNRFSQDMDLIDMRLPILALNTGEAIGSCVVKLVILSIMAKYLAATIPFVGFAVFVVQTCYLRTSRQVRLLDIEAKAPLFTHFMETVGGIVTIRAFGWEGDFQDRAFFLLNESQKPVYMLYCIQQWLTLVLDLIVGAVAVILVAITTSMKHSFSAGSVGVALNMVLTFNSTLTRLVNMWTLLEMSIGAVSRIQSFVKDTPSEERVEVLDTAPCGWPSRGKIDFMDVTAGSSPESPAILSSISLSIEAGEKIAICGPSGSGKTSLILALLQMIDVQQGSIVIDGIDLATMQCNDVRAALNVIPQEPFFMPGSVRFNLDSRGITSDAEYFQEALEKVGLWEKITAKGGIEADLEAADWSVGQRQLLALARALLNKSMVLILDEATSSVDHETEAIMQAVIDKDFAQQTVIAVVHRFAFIHRFDRVGLLKSGVLIECDTPSRLLSKDSEFKKLYDAMGKKK
ncbi:hypothetical protein BP5796_06615 [Coleophoma crateriformis]|uniref:Uncharacterized protein n=1 Tax=Coleophoma crateriformis TaxID=565419 RepID=A0A3D8RPI3_9HELO|nr:hypothetical protein BP5796_06615 [Coleophoma crateriformis]